MADQITDNRTLLSANNSGDTAPDDLTGSADTASNSEVSINGTTSRPFKVSAGVDGRLYDAGSAQDWSNNTFYLWLRCTSVTDTLANGGVRIRFCGATVSNYFEKHVFGGSIGSINGWEMAVVDIEKARADAVAGTDGGTGGTTPATNAIRYVGVVFDVPGMVTGNTDNCFINGFWRLPANTPGIIVEGRNGGSTAWNFADISDAADVNDTTKAWGTFLTDEAGIYKCNTPIQIGINDTTTHEFSDSNYELGWQDRLVPDDFYGITLLGNAGGTTDFDLGSVAGTGDDRTGSQGGVITASATGTRWFLDSSDSNIDSCNLYGASFKHGSDFLLNDSAVSSISVIYNDCTSVNAENIGDFLRCQIVDPNTADGAAFLITNDIDNIKFCTFNFSDGHAIEDTNTSTTPNNIDGNIFVGAYGGTPGSNSVANSGSTDAMIYNNGGVAKTYNILEGGTLPSIRNGVNATTVVVLSPVSLDFIVRDDITNNPIERAAVTILASTNSPSAEVLPVSDSVTITRSGSTATVAHTGHGLSVGQKVAIFGANENEYNRIKTIVSVPDANSYTYTVSGTPTTPATGTITATAIIIDGLTDVNGEISDTRSYSANQNYSGKVQQGTGINVYKARNVSGVINSSNGATNNILLTKD